MDGTGSHDETQNSAVLLARLDERTKSIQKTLEGIVAAEASHVTQRDFDELKARVSANTVDISRLEGARNWLVGAVVVLVAFVIPMGVYIFRVATDVNHSVSSAVSDAFSKVQLTPND